MAKKSKTKVTKNEKEKDENPKQDQSAPKSEAKEKLEETKEVKEVESKKAETETELDKDSKWYVVHTYAGHENKVANTLKQKVKASNLKNILDVMVPTQEKIEVREGKKVTLQEKIFPGYILVRMNLDNESWYSVRSTPGVTGFVGVGNKPTPLNEKEVESIQQFSKMAAPTYKASFSVSEAVKIIDGPFSDFIGSVEEIDEDKGKLKILVSIFGRETPVELDFLQVSKL